MFIWGGREGRGMERRGENTPSLSTFVCFSREERKERRGERERERERESKKEI